MLPSRYLAHPKSSPLSFAGQPPATLRAGRGRRGQILILFMTITAIALLLETALLTLQARVYGLSQNVRYEQSATYLAEAGIEKGYSAFATNPAYTGENLTVGGKTVAVSIQPGANSNERYVVSTVTVQNTTRVLRVKLSAQPNPGIAVAFRYALQSGTGGFNIGNGSTINGNVYSNQNITGSNGSTISGDAYAVGTITKVTVGGQKKSGQPAEALPPFDAAFWKSKAQLGTTINGSYSPPSGSTIGPLYVNGNLTFDNQVNVTVKGAIYATGNITFGNNPVITVDNSIGTNGIMLAADGIISFGNAITINKNAGGGYVLIATTSTASNAISISNTAISVAAPLYAPNGTISIGNSSRAVAFAAKTVVIGNNAIINYDTGLASASFTTGPGGGWVLDKGSYQEIK